MIIHVIRYINKGGMIMENKFDMRFKQDGSVFSFDLYDFVGRLDEDGKKRFLSLFVFEEIIPAIERQLKHETDSDWWSTSGEQDGGRLRAEILKIQGLEPEFKKDLEIKIRSLEHEVEHYRKYYNWYFKLYHAHRECGGIGHDIHQLAINAIGKPE